MSGILLRLTTSLSLFKGVSDDAFGGIVWALCSDELGELHDLFSLVELKGLSAMVFCPFQHKFLLIV